MITWILGGKGGMFVTLCLTFASWLASSSMVILVVVEMWVGSETCSSFTRSSSHPPLHANQASS
ncbi:unnamed protein product [Arabidopsis thaliana]|uniref:(thale cress) hypothetical protein n=1 Tax=Arabidopsis thaliana TaxID=3702 RepID=A0A7G2E207_ARATH|nr:unnamed protein product [Arabidopsis thaliana]